MQPYLLTNSLVDRGDYEQRRTGADKQMLRPRSESPANALSEVFAGVVRFVFALCAK